MSGASVQLAPRAGPGVVFGIDPAEPERFLVRGRYLRPSACVALAVLYFATWGLLEALRAGSVVRLLLPALVAWGALAGAVLRRRLVFDRRSGELGEEYALLFPFARRRRPLGALERVVVSREHAKASQGAETTYAVDIEAGGRLRVDSVGAWEHAAPLAEALARFLGLPLRDEQRDAELGSGELDVPLRDRPPPAATPLPREVGFTVEADRPALLRAVIPRPALPQTLFLFGLVAAFCSIPFTVEFAIPFLRGWRPGSPGDLIGPLVWPLLPVLIVGSGALRHVGGNGGALSVTPERLRFVRNGVFHNTRIDIEAGALENLTLLEPEMGGARSLLAYFSEGVLVARSDERSFRFGYGLSRVELEWLRHRVWTILAQGSTARRAGVRARAPAAQAAPATPLPVFPRWSRLWLGGLAGAAVGRWAGGPLGVCVAVPFLEELLNVGALLGLLAGAAASASLWRRTGSRRAVLGLLALLLGVAAGFALGGRSDLVQAQPLCDERAALGGSAGRECAVAVSHPRRLVAGLSLVGGALQALGLNALLLAAFRMKGGDWRPRRAELASDARRLLGSREAAAPAPVLLVLAGCGAALAALAAGWSSALAPAWPEVPGSVRGRFGGPAPAQRPVPTGATPSVGPAAARLVLPPAPPPVAPRIETGADPAAELGSLASRPVLILCWGGDGLGTWLPDVERLRRAYAARGLAVVGLPFVPDAARLSETLATYRIGWRQYLRHDALRARLPLAWPRVLLLDASGAVVYSGAPGERAEAAVAELLGALPEQPPPGPVGAIEGRVLYAGRPLHEAAAWPVRFWFRDEWRSREAPVQADYDPATSGYRFLAPAATYLVDASAGNRLDREPHEAFGGSMTFAIAGGETQRRELRLERILRLRQPVDNGRTRPPHGELATHASPVAFAWDAVPEATTYRYTVTRLDGAEHRVVVASETAGTAAGLSLPAGRYEFALSAHGPAGRVGRLEVYGENFRAWSHAFRVR